MDSSGQKGVERRHTLLVNKAVQGRFIGIMALFVVIAAALFFVLTLTWETGSLVPVFARLAVALLLVLLGVIYVGLRFSQRVVGPLVAFGHALHRIHRGEYCQDMRLRQHDHLQNLAAGANQTMDALRQRVREDMAFLDALAGQIEGAAGMNPETREALLQQIRQCRTAKENHLVKRT